MTVTKVFQLGLLCVLMPLSCSTPSPRVKPPSVIVKPGVYPSPNGKWSLSVSKTSNGIINYTVADAATGQSLLSAGGFSTYHRWFFFWDQQNQLWTYNSDMGPFSVWSDDGTGKWSESQLGMADDPAPIPLPPEVHSSLPENMQRRFSPATRPASSGSVK